MRLSIFLLAVISIICPCLAGCTSAESPEPTAEVPENTAAQTGIRPTRTPQPMAAVTAEPNSTPTPPPLPTQIIPFNVQRGLPTPTPSLYPDIWISGFMWREHEGLPAIWAGNSSFTGYIGRATYEAANETVAEALAQYSLFTLVVLYGDFTPPGDQDGHIVVKRVEQVNLPYSEDIPLSESYTNPDFGFSFNYPEDWTLEVHENNYLILRNHPSYAEQFHGPVQVPVHDPTEILTEIWISDTTIQDFVDTRWYTIKHLDDLPMRTAVTERIINGLPVTQIDQQPAAYYYGKHLNYFVFPLDDDTLLFFQSPIEDTLFVERLLSTLFLP